MKKKKATKTVKIPPKPKTKVEQLIDDYIADPNCVPELWILTEDVTPEEKKLFILEVKKLEVKIRI